MSRSEMKRFIQGLSTQQATQVMRLLLDDSPDLMKKIYDAAMKVVRSAGSDDIERDVCYELAELEVDDISSRSGRTRHGCVEPYDAAWEMFEETLYPFIDEMKKNQERSLPAVAKAHCIGIIKGLWRYEKEDSSDFKDWVTDAPGEYVHTVVDEWKKGNPSDEDIAEITSFMKDGQS